MLDKRSLSEAEYEQTACLLVSHLDLHLSSTRQGPGWNPVSEGIPTNQLNLSFACLQKLPEPNACPIASRAQVKANMAHTAVGRPLRWVHDLKEQCRGRRNLHTPGVDGGHVWFASRLLQPIDKSSLIFGLLSWQITCSAT